MLVRTMRRPLNDPVALAANELDSALDSIADHLAFVVPGNGILVDLLGNAKGNLSVLHFAFLYFDLVAEKCNHAGQLIGLLNERQLELVRATSPIRQLPRPRSGRIFAETARFPFVSLFLPAPVGFNDPFDVIIAPNAFVGRCDFVPVPFPNDSERNFVADYFAL